ncbi:MAG: IS200/IS605 family transposase [Calditrichaceae bacterium]
MPFVRIWIHLIWSTKNRHPIITQQLKPELLNHIIENAGKKEIYIDKINCVADHRHLLISLGASQTTSNATFLRKGESSHWVNKNKLIQGNFEWQDEYLAVSVSESHLEKIRHYIEKQEEHHRKNSFKDEYDQFIKKYGFKYLG